MHLLYQYQACFQYLLIAYCNYQITFDFLLWGGWTVQCPVSNYPWILPHQAAISFGFSAWICNAITTEGSYRPQMMRIWNWDAHWVRAFWDTGPRYPMGVPWDQFFCLQNFLLSWKYDVILCTFAIYYAKIRVYLVILGHSFI